MLNKEVVSKHVTDLVEMAQRPGASTLTDFTIFIADNGSLEVWLDADGESYGAWGFGSMGKIVGEISVSREDLFRNPVAETTTLLCDLIPYDTTALPPATVKEIYIGNALLAIQMERYVLVTPLFNEVQPEFPASDPERGFRRVTSFDDTEDVAEIMMRILYECRSYMAKQRDGWVEAISELYVNKDETMLWSNILTPSRCA